MHKVISAACAALALGVCIWALDGASAPRFELVSYYESGGRIQSETLDSGLTVDDCAHALEFAERATWSPELLLTCERQR